MADPAPNRSAPRDLAATLDVAPDRIDAPARQSPRVELVECSASGISVQTASLLRSRLRSAALVFVFASLVFLVRGLIQDGASGVSDASLVQGEHWLFGLHVVHVSVLFAVSGLLCSRCPLCLGRLRMAELVIFGFTAGFLAYQQHITTLLWAVQHRAMSNPVGTWYALMFIYAMFIPNTWRRAASVLTAMAAAPIAVLVFDLASSSAVSAVSTADFVSTVILLLLVGLGASAYGTYTIGALRREAQEARQLGQYRLRELIGAGGMGEVYLAEHQLLKRRCAIKLIRSSKADDPLALARFEREVRATATLSHWNTIEIFDYGRTDDGTFYYVMEYLPGMSLVDLVERFGPLPPERVVHLLAQVCDALAEAHSIGLIHRDIKPGNIFAARRGGVDDVAKLLDFGLARPLLQMDSVRLTADGAITGSPLFMAPEQSLGDTELDERSDVYSVGAVAYYLLTGRPPFERDKPLKVLLAHARDPVVPPSHWRGDIPSDLEEIVLRCLAKQPDDRYATAGALRDALAGSSAAGPWTRRRAAAWWRDVAGDSDAPSRQELHFEHDAPWSVSPVEAT